MVSAITSSSTLWSRIGTKPARRLQFGTPFSLLLYKRFTAPFPHPFSSFSSTSVLPFSGNVLLLSGTFPLWFGCRPRITLFSDEMHHYLRKDGLPLATQHDPMTKKLPTGTPPKQPLSHTERRGSRRCKITQLMRIRPSDPNKEHFEDMRGSVSVSRSGIFFQSSERGYEVGMRLFLTMPYSQDPASIAREYLAEVVRRDVLPTGMFGIGIKILMEMGVQHSYNFGGANSR
jgi:hypothetical protein